MDTARGPQTPKTTLKAKEKFASLEYWQSFTCKELKPKSPPTPRQLHSAVGYNDQIFIFGGFASKPTVQFFDDLLSFDFAKQVWTPHQNQNPKANKPSGRHSHSAVVYNNQMWVFGGISDGKQQNDLWCWDFSQNSWVLIQAQPPSPRWGHTAVVFGDSMYIFGGFGETFTNEVWVYSFVKSKWTLIGAKGDIPAPRQFHSAVTYGSSMFVFGGFNGNDFNTFYEFQFEKKKWRKLQDCQENDGRRGHAVTTIGHWMAIHAGRSRTSCRDDILLYNFKEKKWDRSLKDVPSCSPRYFHSLSVWRGMLVIFGGLGIDPKTPKEQKAVDLNDFYLLGKDDSISLPENSHTKPQKDPQPKKQTNPQGSKPNHFPSFLESILREIKLHIVKTLHYIDLLSIGSTNKEWHLISLTESLWESFFKEFVEKSKADKKIYDDAKKKFVVLQAKDGVDTTYWKQLCIDHIPRGTEGFTWLPPSYPPDSELQMPKVDHLEHLSVVMFGEGGSGKSSICFRFTQGIFVYEIDPTIEDNFRKIVTLNNCGEATVMFDILDTAGPEDYSCMMEFPVVNASGFLLCYSITSRRSFDETLKWMDFIIKVKRYSPGDWIPLVLIGTKCDLWDQRQVTKKEGIERARGWDVPFFETSSLTNTLISKPFCALAEMMIWRELGRNKKEKDRNNQKCFIQ